MINELDTVVLARGVEEYGLKEGDIGAVVHVYKEDVAYEVEFITGEGETIAIFTLTPTDIRVVGEREILHVRKLEPA
jgi:hypothetical protein